MLQYISLVRSFAAGRFRRYRTVGHCRLFLFVQAEFLEFFHELVARTRYVAHARKFTLVLIIGDDTNEVRPGYFRLSQMMTDGQNSNGSKFVQAHKVSFEIRISKPQWLEAFLERQKTLKITIFRQWYFNICSQ